MAIKYPEQWMPLSKNSSLTKDKGIYHLTIGKDVVTLSEVEMSVLVYAYKKWADNESY